MRDNRIGQCLLDTEIGAVGLAWTGSAVCAVRLPDDATRDLPTSDAWPDFVDRAREGIRALLAGAPEDLSDVPVDFGSVRAFDLSVYRVCRSIGVGATLTYGQVAARLGAPHAAQAVGRAMARNPVPIIVPCHRVVGTGWLGGFSGAGGTSTKLRILQIESVHGRDAFQTALPI